jgi:hypothetical protein
MPEYPEKMRFKSPGEQTKDAKTTNELEGGVVENTVT